MTMQGFAHLLNEVSPHFSSNSIMFCTCTENLTGNKYLTGLNMASNILEIVSSQSKLVEV